MLPFVAIVAILVFIPFFRRGNLTSAFEYLGNRYGRVPRLYGAISFIVGFFSRIVDGVSATIAMSLAILANIYIGLGALGLLPENWTLRIHSYWVGAAINALFIALAYLISLSRRRPPSNLEGLTVWTPASKEPSNSR